MKSTGPNDVALLLLGILFFLAFSLVFQTFDLFAQTYSKQLVNGKNRGTQAVRPIIEQASPLPEVGSTLIPGSNFGLLIFPSQPNFFGWPAGSVCTLSATNNPTLRSDTWDAAQPVVVFGMQGPLTLGALVGDRFFGADSNDTGSLLSLVQPFIHYDLPQGWYINAAPTLVGEMCLKHLVAPLGPSLGKVQCFGETPVNLQLGAYYNNTEGVQTGPGWQLNFQVQVLFPQ